MIRFFGVEGGRLCELKRDPGGAMPLEHAIWVDLVSPTRPEEDELEAALSIAIPTREDMSEIEASSRLYQEDGALFMTANILSRPARDVTQAALDGRVMAMPVSFVLIRNTLLTVRYHEPRSFHIFQSRAEKGDIPVITGGSVLIGLFEVIIDRLADIVEDAAQGLDDIAARIFDTGLHRTVKGHKLDVVLERIGKAEDLNGKITASVVTLERLVTAMTTMIGAEAKKDQRARLKVMSRDLHSLSDHAARQAGRVTFLLDSTLGKINIEQNGIIKIFSVMSVIFLPPTLIASIYGMNFEFMPELGSHYAYPVVLFLMLLSAVLPYFFFRRKGWL